ncbi:MAG: hypothetical protein WDW38_006613 [Sanguina aurantia]
MFHALNTEIEKQVIGRAHRMGRTTDLRVWHLLHENEMQHASGTHRASSAMAVADALAGAELDAAADAQT